MDRLAGRFRVIAVDLYGAGKTAAWPQHQPMLLDDEVALLRSVFLAAGDRFHLIGHSYGGAIALKAALMGQDLTSILGWAPIPWRAPARQRRSAFSSRRAPGTDGSSPIPC